MAATNLSIESSHTAEVILVLFLCLAFSACRTPVVPAAADATLASHYAHSEKLRATMLRIESLVHDRQFTQSEIDAIRMRQAHVLNERLVTLVNTTDELMESSSWSSLDATQQVVFRQLADLLRSQAIEIERVARTGSSRELEERFQRLNAVCDACHQLYRSP